MSEIAGLPSLSIGPRVRKSPFFDATMRYGARAFTVYNHTYMPTMYTDPVTEYWSLVNDVTLWDVSCQRQVEIAGPDAFRLIQYLTPRDMSQCEVGQCRYLLLTGDDGGIVNDAVMLRIAEDRFWLSPGDGDVLLWAGGVAVASGLDVRVFEPDVSPLQLQGPKSPQVAQALFGADILKLKYYRSCETSLDDIPLVISRTGWSGELGFELYLCDAEHGEALWEKIMQAGRPYGIAPAAPSTIRSVEGGLLSYASDITRRDNPYVFGYDWMIDFSHGHDFIGRDALLKISNAGPRRRFVGVELEGDLPGGSNANFWNIVADGVRIGHVTRIVRSPRLSRNIGFANVPIEFAAIGRDVTVVTPAGERKLTVCKWPWFAAQKTISLAAEIADAKVAE
jgi:aminomethyltransferase